MHFSEWGRRRSRLYAKRKFKAGVMALAAISAMQVGGRDEGGENKLKEPVSKGDVDLIGGAGAGTLKVLNT